VRSRGISSRYFSTFQLLLLGVFGALIVAANVALRMPMKMPGRSGVVWMALLVAVRHIVPQPGAATAAALIAGVLASFAGVGDHGPLSTTLSYLAAGLGVDVVLGLRPQGGAVACALAGAGGNLAKHGVKVLLDLWIGIPTGFVILGRLYPLLTHTVFGLAGGYLGFLVVGALRRGGFFDYLAGKR
jgi:hypothetical protein